MDATAQTIITDTGRGMLVGGLPGAVVGAGMGIIGSGALAQGQAVATRYATAKDHKTHLGGGLAYNILHKYKWLSGVARLEDQYDAKNEAAAKSEYSKAVADYQGLNKYPLFDVWGSLCLGGSEIMDAGSNFASLMSFAAELLGVGLIASAFVSMGVTLPAAAGVEEAGKTIGLVSDGLGIEAEVAKMEYLDYRAAKVGPKASPERDEIVGQMAETNTDTLGTIVKSIVDVFAVVGIPKTLNFGKLKKSATVLGRMPAWIRRAESFAAQAVGPLLKFAGRMKPWLLSAKKLLAGAYKIEDWIAKILSAYGDAKKFLKNTGDLTKQLGHGAGAAYRGAKGLGGSAITSVKEYGSEALNFLKGKFGQAKTLGLSAEKYAGGKIHRAEHWIGEEAHGSGQWMLQNREWIGDTLHKASTIFGVLGAGLGVTALVVPPLAPFLVPAALTFGAASAAARAWYSTSLAVGTIDGSISPEAALNEAKWAAVDTALSVATVGVSNARFIARATTVPGMKAVAPTLNNPAKTAVTLNHILQQTNKLFGLKLGLILRNPKLASRLGWVSKALATAKFVKKLVEMGTSRLLGIAHGVAHGIAGGAKSAWNFAKDTGTGLRHWGEQRAHQAGEFFHNLMEKYYPSPKHDNASGSAAQDIGQCATDKFGILGMGMRNAATNTLAGVIGRHGSPTAKNGGLDLHAHSRSGMSVSEAFHPQGGMSVSEAFRSQGGISVSEAFRQLKGKRKDVRGLDVPTFGNAAWSLRTHLLGYHNHAFGSGVIPTRGGSTAGIGALLRTPFNQSNPFLGLRGMVSTPDAHSQGGMSVSEAFRSQGGISVSEAFRQLEGKGKDVRALPFLTGREPNTVWSALDRGVRGGSSGLERGLRGSGTAPLNPFLGLLNQSNPLNPFLGLQGMVSTPDAYSQGGMSVSEAFRSQGGISVSEAFRQLKGKGKDVRALPFLTGRKPNTVWSALDRGVRGGSSGLERGLRGSGTTLDTGLRGRGQDLDTGWRNSAAVYGSTARLGGGMLDHRLSRIGSGAVKAGRSGANAVDDSFDAAKALQRSGYGDHPDVNPAALRADLRKQSSGFLPDGNIRARLGGHLGFDPGGARLHTGPAAASASRRLNAEAFTIGNDVFFGEGRFDPHTPKGLGLIAHELTHVGQQTGTTGSKARFFSEAGGDQMEREAQHTAEHVLANAGSRSGLFVEDYVREYEGEGGLTQADQQRLDRISVMALAEAQRMLASQGVRGSVNADALDVQVEIDLGEMTDSEAARAWAEAITASLPVGGSDNLHRETAAVQRYQIEGPWNKNDPVHETITQETLKKAGLLGAEGSFHDENAWEYIRGVFWNDDPQGQLFDSNKKRTDDYSSGIEWLSLFKKSEKAAVKGKEFGPDAPLLSRSHFGDMQFIHGMASKDGEAPDVTRGHVMLWAEFTYKVATGEIAENTEMGSTPVPGFPALFPKLAKSTVRQFFGIDAVGETKKRAAGSLLHLIQDSFASGHTEREQKDGHKGKIVSFHSYIHQDEDKHGHDDGFHGGKTVAEKLKNVPGALDAVDKGAAVLSLVMQGKPWAEAQTYLANEVFPLADKTTVAGPGAQYAKPSPTPSVTTPPKLSRHALPGTSTDTGAQESAARSMQHSVSVAALTGASSGDLMAMAFGSPMQSWQPLSIQRQAGSDNRPWYQRAKDDVVNAGKSVAHGAADAAKWVGGTLEGGYNDQATTPQIMTDMGISLIPVVGDVTAARDVSADAYHITVKGEYDKWPRWLSLTMNLIGLVPEAGAVVKDVGRLALRQGGKAAAHVVDQMMHLAGRFLPHLGEDASHLSRYIDAHWGQIVSFAREAWAGILDKASTTASHLPGLLGAAKQAAISRLEIVRKMSSGMLTKAFAEIKNFIGKILRKDGEKVVEEEAAKGEEAVARKAALKEPTTERHPEQPKQPEDNAAHNAAHYEKLKAELTRQESDAYANDVAKSISEGHAFDKHVIEKKEFSDLKIGTKDEFKECVENIVKGAKGSNRRTLGRGRTAYWNDEKGILVIWDPKSPDLGTAFRPKTGRLYFEGLR